MEWLSAAGGLFVTGAIASNASHMAADRRIGVSVACALVACACYVASLGSFLVFVLGAQ